MPLQKHTCWSIPRLLPTKPWQPHPLLHSSAKQSGPSFACCALLSPCLLGLSSNPCSTPGSTHHIAVIPSMSRPQTQNFPSPLNSDHSISFSQIFSFFSCPSKMSLALTLASLLALFHFLYRAWWGGGVNAGGSRSYEIAALSIH